MHKPSTLPGRTRLFVLAALAGATLALSACGGGGGDADPPVPMPSPIPGPGPVDALPAPSIDALAGDWVQRGCVRAGAQSFKRLLRARVTTPATIDYDEGVLTFNGNECAGTPQQAGPTRLGVVTFARAEANTSLSAYWGEFRTVTGTRFGAIWTLRPANLLCLLGDEIPTNQPTLAAVAASLATVPADNCFTR
jgi:hypothetical protein